MTENLYLFFDSECILCARSVQFLLKHDKQKKFVYVALSSNFAKEKLQNFGVNPQGSGTFLFIKNEQLYSESRAAIEVAKSLGFPYSLLQFFIIIPPFIRNGLYRLIAKNRYHWFGRQNHCAWVNEEDKKQFILN